MRGLRRLAPGHEVARLAYFGLYALQHRGQESAGIATCEGGHITTLRETGLVSQVFDEEKLRALEGDMAIGHVRYSTTGGGSWENTQPVWRDDGHQDLETRLGHALATGNRSGIDFGAAFAKPTE